MARDVLDLTMGGYGRRERQRVSHRRDDKLARLDPSAFEELVAGHYRGLGYTVERVGHGGAHFDGGIDLKLRRGSEYIVVQCKRENAYQVAHNVGHELIGVMCTQGATAAIVVNTGEYTRYARESARGESRLTLVDGDEVRRWFPALAQPAEVAQWEPVSLGSEDYRRRRSRRTGKEGPKALMGLAVLMAVMAWQCSRPEPVGRETTERVPTRVGTASPARQSVRPAPTRATPSSNPAATTSAPVDAPPQSGFRGLSPQEMEEWKRGNEESMKVLEENTPELPLPPR